MEWDNFFFFLKLDPLGSTLSGVVRDRIDHACFIKIEKKLKLFRCGGGVSVGEENRKVQILERTLNALPAKKIQTDYEASVKTSAGDLFFFP